MRGSIKHNIDIDYDNLNNVKDNVNIGFQQQQTNKQPEIADDSKLLHETIEPLNKNTTKQYENLND